jgi:hypothetical protein
LKFDFCDSTPETIQYPHHFLSRLEVNDSSFIELNQHSVAPAIEAKARRPQEYVPSLVTSNHSLGGTRHLDSARL